MCNVGLHQIASDSVIIFGGWNGTPQKEVMNLIEKSNGVLSIRAFKDKSGNMQDGDNFLLNGVAVEDPIAQEILIPGQDFVHVFNMTTHKFKTQRKIFPGSPEPSATAVKKV